VDRERRARLGAAASAVVVATVVVAAALVGPWGLTGTSTAQDTSSTTSSSPPPTSAASAAAGGGETGGTAGGSSSGAQQQAKPGPGDIVVSQFRQGSASVISTGEQVSTIVSGLASPTGVVALEDGTVLFAENTGNRISAVGGPYGSTVTAVIPQINGPYALGTSPDQAVYVTQLAAGTVAQVDTRNGKIDPIGSNLSNPTAVTGFNGEVYVAEAGTGKVVKFGTDRKQVDVATDLGTPNGLAIAPDGTMYVSDFTDNKIVKIAPNGDKTDWVQTEGPRQLALDPVAPKAGQDYQIVAGTAQGIVQYGQDGSVQSTVPFADQSVAGVGVVPGGPPPNATPTTPVGTPPPPTVRPSTTVASSGVTAPEEQSSSSAGGILLALLIAIVIIAGVAFALYRYSKRRGKRTEEEAGFTDLRELSVTMTQAMGPCAAEEVELAEAEDTLQQVVGQRLGAEGRLVDAQARSTSALARQRGSRHQAESLRDQRRSANGDQDDAPPPPLSLAELGLTTEAGRAALQAFGRGELDAVKLRERWDELGESSAVAAVQGHSEKIARTTPWPEERQAALAAEQAQLEHDQAESDATDAQADINRMRELETQLHERIEVARVAVDDCHRRQKLADEEAAAAAASALADIQISADLASQGKGKPDEEDEPDAEPTDEPAPVGSSEVEQADHADADDADDGGDEAEGDDEDTTGKIPRPATPPTMDDASNGAATKVARAETTTETTAETPTVQELIDLSRGAHAGTDVGDDPDAAAETSDRHREDPDDADGSDPTDDDGVEDEPWRGRRRRALWRR
jgi:streptogramin lyase